MPACSAKSNTQIDSIRPTGTTRLPTERQTHVIIVEILAPKREKSESGDAGKTSPKIPIEEKIHPKF